jgi:Putative lumazine-binding
MKITILKACLIGILAASSISAYSGPIAGDYDKIVKEYIDSHMNGNYKILKKIMNNDATFKIPRAEKVITQSEPDVVDAMKQGGGIKQNCKASYEVVTKSSALVMVRVDFYYDNCVQQNFLVLEKDEDKQWKIAQVYKIFNDKEPDMTEPKVIANN